MRKSPPDVLIQSFNGTKVKFTHTRKPKMKTIIIHDSRSNSRSTFFP
jgi:hypothetical protein